MKILDLFPLGCEGYSDVEKYLKWMQDLGDIQTLAKAEFLSPIICATLVERIETLKLTIYGVIFIIC